MNIIDALLLAMKAREEEKQASERYTGYEWAHHGYELIKRRDITERAFEVSLSQLIDERIRAAQESSK